MRSLEVAKMKWLDNILEVLNNPKYPQIQGELEKRNDDNEIIGKCALGEMRCSKDVEALDICDSDGVIMKAFDVPEWLWHDKVLPILHYGYNNLEKVDEFPQKFEDGANLQSWIYGLNDTGLTYPEICEWLEITFG